ncbi:ABC transporter permease [Catenulispora yoronensis]
MSRPALVWALSDIVQLTKRSLLHIRRDPDQLVSVSLQPVILVIMFRYLFGGAISTGSKESYINFLMAGILIETAALSATATSTAVAVDMLSGAMDRFRALPIANSAVLAGHVLADLARAALGMAVMVAVGLAVGFRPEAGPAGWLGALALTFLVTFALSWMAACIGLLGSSAEAVQQYGMVLILPIFFSSAFVPTGTMPGWLRVVAENQPMTQAIDAVRALLLDQPSGNHIPATLLWFTGLSAVCVAIAGMLFKARTKT